MCCTRPCQVRSLWCRAGLTSPNLGSDQQGPCPDKLGGPGHPFQLPSLSFLIPAVGILGLSPGVTGRREDDASESALAAAHPVPSFPVCARRLPVPALGLVQGVETKDALRSGDNR